MDKSKDPIRLRERLTSSGRRSLYLDVYVGGHRSYEYLRLYLVPELTRADKERNRQTRQLADAIRAKRVVELRNGQYGFKSEKAPKTKFFDYYRSQCEKRFGAESKGNWGNWFSCLQHLEKYEKRESLTLSDITPDWVQGFKDYLDGCNCLWSHGQNTDVKEKRLARNSRASYFSKLRACLNQALADGLISRNPAQGVGGMKTEEVTRMYLTLDEIRTLVRTDCNYPAIKSAFLFSCLTGLRRSDVARIRWEDVHQQGGFTRIIFRQKKTGGQEYLDITPEAVELMGERGGSTECVFKGLHKPSVTNRVIKAWVARAGIDKDITFHCARHTFAVMMLDLGTDIYTVSKLLGHRELSTTQIYAKVLDKAKQTAIASIPSVLSTKAKGTR